MSRNILFLFGTLLCLLPQVTTPLALFAGILFGVTLGVPWPAAVQNMTKWLLQVSVVGLGFGIPIAQVLETGRDNIAIAMTTIALALLLGFLFARALKLQTNIATLITVGTGICGGSAIAAVAPAIRAKPEEMSVALASVFSLNAVALFLFPLVGKYFQMSQHDFGLWAALAIHDTSSVVGAASIFGSTALKVATTVKLSRVLFVIPIVVFFAVKLREKGNLKFPWFILFFLGAALIRGVFLEFQEFFEAINWGAKQALCVILFWVGAGLNRESLSKVGFKPFAFAIGLWIGLTCVSFFMSDSNFWT